VSESSEPFRRGDGVHDVVGGGGASRAARVPASVSITGGSTECGFVADDGGVCHRRSHMEEPDAHDFSERVRATRAVDGGRRWSEWIRTVHLIRETLQSVDDLAKLADYGYARRLTENIAALVDLVPTTDPETGSEVFGEKERQ
jgi:hypothetical protein